MEVPEALRGKKLRARCYAQATDAPPLLLNFGVVPPTPEVLADDNALTFKLYGKGPNARFLTVDSEHVVYSARENAAQQPAKYAVGLVQEDGTLNVYPALPIFRLQARAKGATEHLPTPKTPESMMEQRKLLVESFGSKKKKTEVRTKGANRVVADDLLHKSFSAAAGKSLFTVAAAARRIDVPPYDETTDVPSKCYDIKALLTPEGWAIATQNAPTLLANAHVLPSWVQATWAALSNWTEADAKRRRRREKLLAYVIYVFKFLRVDRASLNKPLSQHVTAIPDAIGDHLLKEFTELQGTERVRTKLHTNKLINTLLIAMLDIDDYVLKNMPLIAADLRMKIDEYAAFSVRSELTLLSVIQHLRSIGCQVASKTKRKRDSEGKEIADEEEKATGEDGGWKVKLIAPLKFPEVRKGGKAGRK